MKRDIAGSGAVLDKDPLQINGDWKSQKMIIRDHSGTIKLA
jgi:hypothetical protein